MAAPSAQHIARSLRVEIQRLELQLAALRLALDALEGDHVDGQRFTRSKGGRPAGKRGRPVGR